MNRSTRKLALLGGGAGLGAGLMYLLDPQGGGRRRALARDKAVRAYHAGSEALRKSSVDLAHRSRGLIASANSALHGDVDNELMLHESAEGVPALENGGRQRRLHLPTAARLIAGTAGGALALAGLARMIRSTGATTAFARK